MLEIVAALIPLVFLIFKECFSAQARGKEENRKFELNQATLKGIVDAAVQSWLQSNSKDSRGASKAWDNADEN
jgi:hypothetical protein